MVCSLSVLCSCLLFCLHVCFGFRVVCSCLCVCFVCVYSSLFHIHKTNTNKTDGGVAEKFVLPSPRTFAFLCLNGVLALLFNLFFMFSLALTSPVITSVACMLSIPLSALVCSFVMFAWLVVLLFFCVLIV